MKPYSRSGYPNPHQTISEVQYNYLIFAVKDGRVEVEEFDQYECRGDNALAILNALVLKAPDRFEGKRGVMSFWDYPLEAHFAESFDFAFCSTKIRGEVSPFIEMPCPYSLSWPQVGVPDGEALMRELLELAEQPDSNKIFWIGAETHHTRRRLHELSLRHPEIIDAELMSWNRNSGTLALRSESRYVSLRDHARFRYLVDCPGAGYSGRIRWLLATGRPLFIVDRTLIEHWHEEMVPWAHYIPVREDLSDLIEAYQRVEDTPGLYEEIGRNARKFVRDHLLLEKQLERMVAATERWRPDEN